MNRLVTIVCAAVGISAIGGIVLSLVSVNTAWFLMGFEAVTLFAAVFGVLLGRGKFSDGMALGVLSVAGAIVAAGLFGYLGAGKAIPVGARTISLTPLLLGRMGAGVLLAGCSAWAVLGVQPGRSLPLVVRGLACGIPAVGVVWGVWALRAKIAGMGLSQVALALGGLVVGGLVIGLLASAVHLTIKAFTVADSAAAGKRSQG